MKEKKIKDNCNWDYFSKDAEYSDVLRSRLKDGVEMDSAIAIAKYMNEFFRDDLDIIDFGGGPGHYYPVIKKFYRKGNTKYTSIDIDSENIKFGNSYFHDDENANFLVGSVLDPKNFLQNSNCIISANTLPHVPNIDILLKEISKKPSIRFFIFRMLIGNECVQIKKHLQEDDFSKMFKSDFQHNNIYSLKYIKNIIGVNWNIEVKEDIFDETRLKNHSIPAQENNKFYSNRVSRSVDGMVFKGDIYMPWKFVIGTR